MKSRLNLLKSRRRSMATDLLGLHRPKRRLPSARKIVVISLVILCVGVLVSVVAERLQARGLSIAKLVLCSGVNSCACNEPSVAARAKRDSEVIKKGVKNGFDFPIPYPD